MVFTELSDANQRLVPGEELRLLDCAIEPIRTPGAVQSHGVVLGVDPLDLTIQHVSANADELLGVPAELLLGGALDRLPIMDPPTLVADVVRGDVRHAMPLEVTIAGRPFDVVVHRSPTLILVDLEPSLVPDDPHSASTMYDAILRLSHETTAHTLWAEVAREIRFLTGYDRVMVYHFHPDGHGEVVAEEKHDEMEPFLGLHYPASDIPAQARELYLSKLSRVIASSTDGGSELLSVDGGVDVDLSQSELRAVSPHHRQFMRNMGQASTLSLSLVHDGVLVGMITCANRTPVRVPFVVRQGLEVLANQVALQLISMRDIDRLTRQIRIRSLRNRLLGQVSESTDLVKALLFGEITVLDLVPSDGVLLFIDGERTVLGAVPSAEVMAVFTSAIIGETGGLALTTDALADDHPELAPLMPDIAGIVMHPLGGEGSYLAWFRQEVARTVSWLGDLSDTNRETPLSPRNSFSAWNQSVHGTSLPWEGLDIEAEQLCRDLDGELLRRAESKLALLALHDPLTGLPNRRLLADRLEHALTKYARGEEITLLFIDLDSFKSINDEFGHSVGDAVIVHAAMQIIGSTRAQDTVARLGGDEFVVLCENTSAEEGDLIAARILESIREIALVEGNSFSITASIGVSAANLTFTADEILRAADDAMYRAKTGGRNRASR
jgi:chemotaxis family two-component system sensor kinase Cph1